MEADKMENTVKQIAFEVSLINGKSRTHAYDLPSTEAELEEFISKRVDNIVDSIATAGEKAIPLYFYNPLTVYNPKNVVSVSITNITESDFQKAIYNAQKRAGFIK
jgi:tRNA A37 threonylcarbamoyladenosine dehydratase